MTRYSHHGLNQHSESPLQAKSNYARSPPRVFIKPKAEDIGDNHDRFERRASFAVVQEVQKQRNARPSLPTSTKSTYALPRRSSSVSRTANQSIGPSTTRIPRSTTSIRPMKVKPISGPEAGGYFAQDSTNKGEKADKVIVRKPKRESLPANKENSPPARASASPAKPPAKASKGKRTFVRKQSPLVPADSHLNQDSPPKTFLLPKVDEYAPTPERLLPRRSSVRSVVPRGEKRESLAKKKPSLPSLPTIVIMNTPKAKPPRHLKSEGDKLKTTAPVPTPQPPQPILTPVMKPSPRPFLLPGSIPSLTSLSSLLSLPSQILKHTPISAQIYRTPHTGLSSDSPCLSKARTKTIWTLVDEMKLIRSGGQLSDGYSLEPSSQARVVPLCQRLRNGVTGSMQSILDQRTPVRSVSTPYHLLASADRRSRAEPISALPPVPSISRVLAHAGGEWEESPVSGRKGERVGERYNWTLVDVKKQEHRSTPTIPAVGGYGVYVGTVNSKPSLLTRAQTLMKLKFSGSRKVVGRGDPRWL